MTNNSIVVSSRRVIIAGLIGNVMEWYDSAVYGYFAVPVTIFIGEVGFVIALALFGGGAVATNVEIIPSAVRCTGLAFAYNASIGWFGGTTPMISAWLITSTGNPIGPATGLRHPAWYRC